MSLGSSARSLSQVLLPVFLTLSLLLNIFLLANWIWLLRDEDFAWWPHAVIERTVDISPTNPPVRSGWSQKAAIAAEAAALFNCSGNGDLYVDTIPIDMVDHVYSKMDSQQVICECYECFTGPHCAEIVPNCEANVDSGNPLLFATFWKQNAEQSAVVIPGWYRMGYETVEASISNSLTPALEKEIRTLHMLVGNAVVDNKYIVLGVGSMQLLNAAVASLSPATGDPANVVSAVPYYGAYRTQTQMLETSHFKWAGDANLYAEQQSILNGSFIEFVTSPNNPDGTIRTAVLNGSTASTIYDLAYYWPHFTAITAAMDHDVMLFTLSKVTGHAGSRIGWAIVEDYSVYTRLLSYVGTNVITVSHESQLRATQFLRAINKAYSTKRQSEQKMPLSLPPIYYASHGLSFHYAYAILRYRWKKLSYTLEKSQLLSLQELEPNYCNFFGEVTGPSPAYAWVYCKQSNEQECQELFSQAGIIPRSGSAFGANDRHARFSMLKRESVFESLVDHLSALVSQENSNQAITFKGNLLNNASTDSK